MVDDDNEEAVIARIFGVKENVLRGSEAKKQKLQNQISHELGKLAALEIKAGKEDEAESEWQNVLQHIKALKRAPASVK